MEKGKLLWMCAALLLAIGLSSCSSDDDFSSDGLTGNDLTGRWDIVRATYGLGGIQEYQDGELRIIFNNSSKCLTVQNNGIPFLKSGNYLYNTQTEQRRILNNEFDKEYQVNVIIIHYSDEVFGNQEVKYTYFFRDGMLILDGGIAYDGPGYFFEKQTFANF